MVAAPSPFCAFIKNVESRFGGTCNHVFDAVLMVTKGHEMVKRDDLLNLAPMVFFAGYPTSIRVLLKRVHSYDCPIIRMAFLCLV